MNKIKIFMMLSFVSVILTSCFFKDEKPPKASFIKSDQQDLSASITDQAQTCNSIDYSEVCIFPGWNLVSLNPKNDVPVSSASEFMKTQNEEFNCDNNILMYHFDKTYIQTKTLLAKSDNSFSYFVKNKNNKTYKLKNSYPYEVEETIKLSDGWHMIQPVYQKTTLNEFQKSITGKILRIWEWDPSQGYKTTWPYTRKEESTGYNEIKEFLPNIGYWFKVSNDFSFVKKGSIKHWEKSIDSVGNITFTKDSKIYYYTKSEDFEKELVTKSDYQNLKEIFQENPEIFPKGKDEVITETGYEKASGDGPSGPPQDLFYILMLETLNIKENTNNDNLFFVYLWQETEKKPPIIESGIQKIPLHKGLNNFSFDVNKCYYIGGKVHKSSDGKQLVNDDTYIPMIDGIEFVEVNDLNDFFSSIKGKYDMVKGFDVNGASTYIDGSSDLSDMKYIAAGYGYTINILDNADFDEKGLIYLEINGDVVADNTALSLLPPPPSDVNISNDNTGLYIKDGWNFVGYLGNKVKYVGEKPNVPFPEGSIFEKIESGNISEAFKSIDGQYSYVYTLNQKGEEIIYKPKTREKSLQFVGPGYGYWIKINEGKNPLLVW